MASGYLYAVYAAVFTLDTLACCLRRVDDAGPLAGHWVLVTSTQTHELGSLAPRDPTRVASGAGCLLRYADEQVLEPVEPVPQLGDFGR